MDIVENTSANAQEVAEPETTGAKEQEVAAPAEEHKQSAEDNARYAAIRRKAEEDAARKAKAETDSLIASLGLVNPYTNTPVRTREEIQAYQEEFAKEKARDIQQKAEMSEEEYNAFISSLPEVREARAIKEQAQAKQIETTIAEQIAAIGQLNPDIKSMQDLAQDENFRTMYEMVGKGYSLYDAYRITNFDKLAGRSAETAKQQAMNAINTKEHLTSTSQRGAGAEPVPASVMAKYRMFNPHASDSEIQAHYNRMIHK